MAELYKIKFIKKTDLKEVGDIVSCSKNSAEDAIKNGYAEYIEQPIKKEKKIIKKQETKSIKKIKETKEEIVLSNKEIDIELLKTKDMNDDEKESFLEELSKKSKKPVKKLKQQLSKLFPSPKKILLDQSNKQEFESFGEQQINWLEDSFWDEWSMIKNKAKKMWGHKKEYSGEVPKMFFLSHCQDQIKGRPQLIERVQKKIPLVSCATRKEKNKEAENGEIEIQSFYFFDDKFDKRYDGSLKETFAMDFWMYRIISEEGKEYYILTQEELPNEVCTFNGMLVELDDFAEMSKSMKIKSLSRIFFMKDFIPSVKILTPKAIITYTKEREITEKDWLDFLAYHPKFDSYNRFPGDIEIFKSAHLLSSKVDDYPLHLGVMGPQGTRKSKGYIETVAYKFSDNPHIVEGANSRIKGLSPSFKEKPANLGYLVNCNRMGWVDEIGKMVEFELDKHQTTQGNVLGELNSLLDHSSREVVSGNDNSVQAEATAKFCFVLNPISKKRNISEHVGSIDTTTMSRLLWWVQDDAEQSFVKGREGIIRNPPTPTQAQDGIILLNKDKKGVDLKILRGDCVCVGGKVDNREEFLTLFDTCQSFLCMIDDDKVFELSNVITQLAREPMKGVWEPRAEHHVKLLIDGLVKHRCLFKDYDETFTPKQEDYDLAERILIRMVKGWDTNLSVKREWQS